jgi:hypothetical protein
MEKAKLLFLTKVNQNTRNIMERHNEIYIPVTRPLQWRLEILVWNQAEPNPAFFPSSTAAGT